MKFKNTFIFKAITSLKLNIPPYLLRNNKYVLGLNLFIFSLFFSMSLSAQNNYGNWQSSSNDNIGIGTPSNPSIGLKISHYQRGIYSTSWNDAIVGLTYSSQGNAIYGLALYGGYAGRFYGKVKIGTHASTPSEKLAIAGGSVHTNTEGHGYLLRGLSTEKSDWGGAWYGLTQGDANKFSLGRSNTNTQTYNNPILLQGRFGIALRTDRGNLCLDENGTVTIGLEDARIRDIAAQNEVNYNLFVDKGIRTEKITVDAQSLWPDYVFEENYDLQSLEEVETFIEKNKHLPNVPSAKVIEKDGINIGEMNTILLGKVEELTLHLIEQNKAIKALEQQNITLQNQIKELQPK